MGSTLFVAVLICSLSFVCKSIQQEYGIILQDGNNYGDDPYHGRVELCLNEQYGTLCYDTITDTTDAICNVLCTQLGYTTCDGINDASYAPPGTGTIWLNNIKCDDTHLKITDCAHDIVTSNDICSHDKDIKIQCSDYIAGCEGGFISTECVITPPAPKPTTLLSVISSDMKPTTKRPTNNPTTAPVCFVATDAPTDITLDPTSAAADHTSNDSNPTADSNDTKATQWWMYQLDYRAFSLIIIICLCCCSCAMILFVKKLKGINIQYREGLDIDVYDEGEETVVDITGADHIHVVPQVIEDTGLPPAPAEPNVTHHGIELSSSEESDNIYDGVVTKETKETKETKDENVVTKGKTY